MKLNILETSLYVDELDQAETFYRDILGLELHHRVPGRHAFFRCEGQMLLLFSADATLKPAAPGALPVPVPVHGARGAGHVCFAASIAEIEQWRVRLLSKAVEIEADFIWPSGGRSIYFRDPSGNSLEFAEPRIWNL